VEEQLDSGNWNSGSKARSNTVRAVGKIEVVGKAEAVGQ
jgi:hypothetical protein